MTKGIPGDREKGNGEPTASAEPGAPSIEEVTRLLDRLEDPERILRATAIALRYRVFRAAGKRHDDPLFDAARVCEALWLALRRGTKLPDAWASSILETPRGENEALFYFPVASQHEAIGHMFECAEELLGYLQRARRTKPAPKRKRVDASFVARAMCSSVARMAPWLCGPFDTDLLSRTREALTTEIEAHFGRTRFDAKKLVSLTLGAFGMSRTERDNALRTLRAKNRNK
ncbi:MAG: hypothetical protein U0441_14800 [Polyangiaceae bacterium]